MIWTYDAVTRSVWSDKNPDKPLTISILVNQGVDGNQLAAWLTQQTTKATEKVRVGSPQAWGRRLAKDGNRIMSQGLHDLNPRTWLVWTLPDNVPVESWDGWIRYGPYIDGFDLDLVVE